MQRLREKPGENPHNTRFRTSSFHNCEMIDVFVKVTLSWAALENGYNKVIENRIKEIVSIYISTSKTKHLLLHVITSLKYSYVIFANVMEKKITFNLILISRSPLPNAGRHLFKCLWISVFPLPCNDCSYFALKLFAFC